MAIFRRGRRNWGKNRDFRPIGLSRFGIDDCCSVECRQQFRPRRRPFIAQTHTTKRHASVNLVYDSKPLQVRYAEENRTAFRLIVRTGRPKSEVEMVVKDCARAIILLKANYKHE